MSMVYNEDERLLADAASGFLDTNAPVAALRALRDANDANGFSHDLWRSMVAMGWAGILVPEEFGGLGFGHVGAGILCEHSGRVLAASPLFATAILGATLIREAGSQEQKNMLLPAVAEGRLLLALAVDETARHNPLHMQLRAQQTATGFRLSGSKTLVIDGHVADQLIIAARSAGNAGDSHGISLFLVDREALGAQVERTLMLDSRNAAELHLQALDLPTTALLGELHGGWRALERALDIARICIAAELLGVAGEAFARSVDYLKQRKQFGALIGGFQALQHRAATLYCELELTRSAVLRALRAIDEPGARLAALASLAKAKAGETATLAVNEAVQMHGGIGMTDALDIGLFIKRAATLRQLFGDNYFHTDRFAALQGY